MCFIDFCKIRCLKNLTKIEHSDVFVECWVWVVGGSRGELCLEVTSASRCYEFCLEVLRALSRGVTSSVSRYYEVSLEVLRALSRSVTRSFSKCHELCLEVLRGLSRSVTRHGLRSALGALAHPAATSWPHRGMDDGLRTHEFKTVGGGKVYSQPNNKNPSYREARLEGPRS